MSPSQLHHDPLGLYPCRPAPDHRGIQGAGLGFTMTGEPPRGGYRVMLYGANSSGDAGLGGDRYTQRAGYRRCRMRGYATIPAPCYTAARAEGVEAEIELPFTAPHQAGGNVGSAGVPARSLARCAESGVRRDGRAAPDHLCGMAGCPGLVVGDGRRPDALCVSSAYVEITLLCSSLRAD